MIRDGILSWDQYFMSMAHLAAKRSKDPSTQVGACIVNSENKIVGIGYNGMPSGCNDDLFPWERIGEVNETKYPYIVHAELNAILNSIKDLRDCRIYVSLFPCNECAKAIIQSGIKEIIYEDDKYACTDSVIASKKMLSVAKVKFRSTDFKIDLKVNIK